EVDRTLEPRSELLYESLGVLEPFNGTQNTTLRPGGHHEEETLLFVRRGEYSLVKVEARLGWLPAAYPLRKECYTLVRDEEGVVSLTVPGSVKRCRLSTAAAET